MADDQQGRATKQERERERERKAELLRRRREVRDALLRVLRRT
jgi:hypothetical protein